MSDSHLRHLLILIKGVRVININLKDNKRAFNKSRLNSIDIKERQRQCNSKNLCTCCCCKYYMIEIKKEEKTRPAAD